VKQATCIHSYVTPDQCKRPAFTRKTHGWLCLADYRAQSETIPPKPRLLQPRWIGLQQQNDSEIIKDILATDAARIAAGRIVEVRRGVLEPVVLRLLEPVVVH
jgi:hypothetical protein